MKIIALLTGRGNNTFKDKNIAPVLGKPLMFYPAQEAKDSSFINGFYCSSDDDKILNCAHDIGYKMIKRPSELSTPTSQHIDAINHALQIMQDDGNYPDILVVLLCNNAIVKTEWIDRSISMILDDQTITSVCPVERDQDHHPFRAKTIDESGFLKPFFDFTGKAISTNRQDLPPCMFLCHNFWTINIKRINSTKCVGQQPWTFLGDRIKYIELDECFDVHTPDDIKRTEKWIEANQ